MLYQELCKICGEGNVLCNEPMKLHTSFHIGGPADYFVMPAGVGELDAVVKLCDRCAVPWFILGNGTNLLVSDDGYRGVILQLQKNRSECCVEKEIIAAQAGILLSRLAKTAGDASLTGLEFASGIPGTLGGAVVMNAGAYGGEMKDVLTEVTVYVPGEGVKTMDADKLALGYRTSIFKQTNWIVLEARLKLKPGDQKQIFSRMEELKAARTEKQPIDMPSAGSAFKRPPGYFAGKLIMDAGLKGYTVGGAQVSEKHCGFVVNTGGATAADVRRLFADVIRIVQEQFDVTLEPEVRFLGDFNESQGQTL